MNENDDEEIKPQKIEMTEEEECKRSRKKREKRSYPRRDRKYETLSSLDF